MAQLPLLYLKRISALVAFRNQALSHDRKGMYSKLKYFGLLPTLNNTLELGLGLVKTKAPEDITWSTKSIWERHAKN